MNNALRRFAVSLRFETAVVQSAVELAKAARWRCTGWLFLLMEVEIAMVERIQAGRVYVVELNGHRMPVHALRPLGERPGWWMTASCRSETPVRVPATAFEQELDCQTSMPAG